MMIQDVLKRYSLQSAQEVQFRLGHRTTLKKNREWVDADSESLTLSEWEDLKDFCLRPDEKMFLETKGYIRGLFTDQNSTWIFSFVEWKDNLKAYFSYVTKANNISHIQNPVYWDALKNKTGMHLITGFKQSGKSTLLREILEDSKKNSPQQIVVHSDPSFLTQQLDETIFQLGVEAFHWDNTHPFYDGSDVIVVDLNDISNWKKWIQFAEEGKKVFLTASAQSVENVLMQVRSTLSVDSSLWCRFVEQISTVLNQRIVGLSEGSIQEILVFKKNQKKALFDIQQMNIDPKRALKNEIEELNHYQSLNQSILQAIVRRRFDVKTAFSVSDNPDELDQQLKKIGL